MDPAPRPASSAAVPQLSPCEPITAMLPLECWAALTYGEAVLGDARRTRRLVATMAAIAANPSASLPQQVHAPAALKATYRAAISCQLSAIG